MNTTHQTLILGLGDVARGDDGFGPLIVSELVREYELDPFILVMDAPAAGVRLLPFFASVQHLLVIAAVRLGAPPGTLHRLEWTGSPDSIEPRLPALRPSGVEVLRMMHYWVDPVPDLVLLGVEALRPASVSRMSEPVMRALDVVVRDAAGELHRWGHMARRRAAGALQPTS
ncbi:MAG TPA: hydrogenase maturation protease [Gemmatimonadales bacterium]